MGVTTEPPWVNKSGGVAARNGTNTHVVPFGFTSTSGNLLVAIMFGAVTHTASGWTEQLSPVSSGELSVFTKTSAGDSSITAVHNGSNYSVEWIVYELPAGSTYVGGDSANSSAETFPTLGLSGAEMLVIAARGRTATGSETGASTVWAGAVVEDLDVYDAYASSTDGGHLTVGHEINVTSTSYTPSATTTYTGTWSTADRERVIFAINAVAPSSLTPFTKDYTVLSRVLGGFTKDYTVLARVLGSFTKDYVVLGRVLASFTKDYVALARVLGSFSKDYVVLDRVLGTFVKDYTVLARVLASFTRDYVIVADILSGTQFTKDYVVSARVLGSFSSDYTILSRVLGSFTSDYAILSRVLGAWSMDYVVLNRILGTWQRDYGVLAAIRGQFTKDYVILARVLTDTPEESTVAVWSLGVERPATVTIWRGGVELPAVISVTG